MFNREKLKRREFIKKASLAAGGLAIAPSVHIGSKTSNKKIRVALVGTGIRGTTMWGRDLVQNYSDYVEFVGLCDINPGRLSYAKNYIGADCPVFTNFEEMMTKTKPEKVIVTTVDSTHHKFIKKGMKMGADIITEKPMTTDEFRCQDILNAERETGKNVRVTFNYRYVPLTTKIKELLMEKRIGEIVSVDFHWYLNVHHGASYFRRWHGLTEKSGTLLVHKAAHHFDVLNWFLDSDPELIYAWGDLTYYGSNNSFRSQKCRGCEHRSDCKFYWDITSNQRDVDLYVKNEKYDGYIRDACIWRHEIDIYDKMAVQIKYANNVFTSYSLTTYSPYEGWRIAFNGTKGRIDASLGIPWEGKEKINQDRLHKEEMYQKNNNTEKDYYEIMVMDNFGSYERIKVPKIKGGHGGADGKLKDQIFKYPGKYDPYKYAAGTRDGAMAILIGIGARNSIEQGKQIKIADLTELKPYAERS